MSANLYNVESLLVGKTYRSNTLIGEIVSAEKSDVWYANAEAYRVLVRTPYSYKDNYRIVAVKAGE
jgi:hypothetical protein